MKHVVPLLLVSFLAGPYVVKAESGTRVNSIDITGNRFHSDGDILRIMNTAPGKIFSSEILGQDLSSILQLYKDGGHFLSEVKILNLGFDEDSSQVDIFLHIDEGAEQKVGTISVRGNTRFRDDEILAAFDTRPGKSYNDAVLERDIEGILNRYEESGYPFCRVEPGQFRVNEEHNIDFNLNIVEGPQVWIGDIIVSGNETTKDFVVLRETRLKKGELFRGSEIAAAQKRLERLGYFSKVSPFSVELANEDTVAIVIILEEGRTSMVNGVVGYNPAQGNQEGYITGLIDFSAANLLGTGRRIDARWHRRDPYSSNLGFGYEEPWILGTPLRVGVTLEQVDQDSSYVLTRAGLALGAELGHNLSGGVRLGWDRVVPDSTGGAFLARSTKYTAEVQASYDTRDNRWNPRRGLCYRTSVEYGRKRNRATPTVSPERLKVRTSKFTLDLEHFVPTFRRHVIALALHGREFRSGEKPVPVSEHFRLGGASTLRGYREDQFNGTRVAWSNLEYRYILASRSRAFLFFDLGMYYRDQLNPDTGTLETVDRRKFGYGLGFRLESRLGIIGLDFGLGEGESFSQGKIHFRLENQF